MKDLHHNISVTQLLEPQDIADTDTATALIDLQGYNSAELVVNVGTITGVDGSNYMTIVAQECDTTVAASFTDVAANDLLGAFTVIDSTAEDSTVQHVGYVGGKRYLRVSLEFTGTGITANVLGVLAILGHPRHAPATDKAATAAT